MYVNADIEVSDNEATDGAAVYLNAAINANNNIIIKDNNGNKGGAIFVDKDGNIVLSGRIN